MVDVGKGVLFFPILEHHGKRTALAYLAAMIVEVVLLAVGVLALLMIVPWPTGGGRRRGRPGWANALGSLPVQSNAMAYQTRRDGARQSGAYSCVGCCSGPG